MALWLFAGLGCSFVQSTHHSGVGEGCGISGGKKYQGLPPGHFFTPVAIETLGAIGPKSMVFLRELGRRIRAVTDHG